MIAVLLSTIHELKKPLHMCAAALKTGIEALLLQGFGYVAGADATGTGLDGLNAAICYGSDLLQVRIPHGTGLVVGVAHIVSEAGSFSTNITFSRHIIFPPSNY
jgi:hypothetical protein